MQFFLVILFFAIITHSKSLLAAENCGKQVASLGGDEFADVLAPNSIPRNPLAHGDRVTHHLETWRQLTEPRTRSFPIVRLGADRRGLLVDRASLLNLADWRLNGRTGTWDSPAPVARLLTMLDHVVRRNFLKPLKNFNLFWNMDNRVYAPSFRKGYSAKQLGSPIGFPFWAVEKEGELLCYFQYQPTLRQVLLILPLPGSVDIRDDWHHPDSSNVAAVVLDFVPRFGFRLAAAGPLRREGHTVPILKTFDSVGVVNANLAVTDEELGVEVGYGIQKWNTLGFRLGTLASVGLLLNEHFKGKNELVALVAAPVMGGILSIPFTLVVVGGISIYQALWGIGRTEKVRYAEMTTAINAGVFRLLHGELLDGQKLPRQASSEAARIVGHNSMELAAPNPEWEALWKHISPSLLPTEQCDWRILFSRAEAIGLSPTQTRELALRVQGAESLNEALLKIRQELNEMAPPATYPSWNEVPAFF